MLHIIPSAPSTNAAIPPEAEHGYAVMALNQTQGRGQRGNHWEAEPGKNVTLSIMLHPHNLPAREQFFVSEAVALGVLDVVRELVPDEAFIKWPNDIYVGVKKIAGILIENSISHSLIRASTAGIGLNVNQVTFHSDAPNPVSLSQLTSEQYNVEEIGQKVVTSVLQFLDTSHPLLHSLFFSALYRRDGFYPYRDAKTRDVFLGRIDDVMPDGCLVLSLPSGQKRKYYFKEVEFIR